MTDLWGSWLLQNDFKNTLCEISLQDPNKASRGSSTEQKGNDPKGFKGFPLKNGSRQGQNLALTIRYVPKSLDSGTDPELTLWKFDGPCSLLPFNPTL